MLIAKTTVKNAMTKPAITVAEAPIHIERVGLGSERKSIRAVRPIASTPRIAKMPRRSFINPPLRQAFLRLLIRACCDRVLLRNLDKQARHGILRYQVLAG